MKTYLGCKVIKAELMDKETFLRKFKTKDIEGKNENGYHVVYPNSDSTEYHSWSPLSVFENSYREFTNYEMSFITKCDSEDFLCPECGKDTLYQDGNSIKCTNCGVEL